MIGWKTSTVPPLQPLKPCPICGCGAKLCKKIYDDGHTVYLVECANGDESPDFDDADFVTGWWNNRVCDGSRKQPYNAICPACMNEYRANSENPQCPQCGSFLEGDGQWH